jgi:hypothetical protein
MPAQVRDPELEAAIRRRASELWEQRGRVDGHGVEDWVQAEKEVTAAWNKKAGGRQGKRTAAAMVVKVKDVTYTVEYDPQNAAGYEPGEFAVGEAMELRFEGAKMFVRRHNGSEFETRVVKKEKRHARKS